MNKVLFILSIVVPLGLIATTGAYLFAITGPETQLGTWWFKTAYVASEDKDAYLKRFDTQLKAYESGYIPEKIDTFLCTRLQTSKNEAELNAITDFYAFKGGGREGLRIFLLPPAPKQRIIGRIMQRLDSYRSRDAEYALILVETLRHSSQKFTFKGRLISTANSHGSSSHESWLEQKGLPEAKQRFRQWWHRKETWEQKAKRDPLNNSSVQISGV